MNKFFDSYLLNSSELPLVSIENNIYRNNLFDISFKIPNEWYVVSLNEFSDKLKDQILSGFEDDFKDEVIKEISDPVCVLTKYDPDGDEYNGIVSPTIIFGIDIPEPYEEIENLLEYAERLDEFEDLGDYFLKNFKVLKRGRIKKIKERDSIMYETEYLFEHPELENSVMVEMDVLNIEFGDFFIDFSMTHCAAQNQLATKEFKDFINSINF